MKLVLILFCLFFIAPVRATSLYSWSDGKATDQAKLECDDQTYVSGDVRVLSSSMSTMVVDATSLPAFCKAQYGDNPQDCLAHTRDPDARACAKKMGKQTAPNNGPNEPAVTS